MQQIIPIGKGQICFVYKFKRMDLTIDHIVAESKVGSHEIDNFQTLCWSCNSRKGVK